MDPFFAGVLKEGGKRVADAAINQMTQCPSCHEKISIGNGPKAAWSCPRCKHRFSEGERRRLGGR